MSPPPGADAFVTADVVRDIWRALADAPVLTDAARAHLESLGVRAPERTLRGELTSLTVGRLDAFPRLDLAKDPHAPTCTRDLPLRAWVKRRLRERGEAIVLPLRSLARDVVVNLYLHYLRDGRRDFLRGAALADGDTPIVIGAARGPDVGVVDGLAAWLAEQSAGRSRTIAAPIEGTRDDVAAWLTR